MTGIAFDVAYSVVDGNRTKRELSIKQNSLFKSVAQKLTGVNNLPKTCGGTNCFAAKIPLGEWLFEFTSELGKYGVRCARRKFERDDVQQDHEEMKLTLAAAECGVGPDVYLAACLTENRNYYYHMYAFDSTFNDLKFITSIKKLSGASENLLSCLQQAAANGFLALDIKRDNIVFRIVEHVCEFRIIDFDPMFTMKLDNFDKDCLLLIMSVLLLCDIGDVKRKTPIWRALLHDIT